MSSKAHSPSVKAERSRIQSRAAGAAEVLTLADRVKVEREAGRIKVTLQRRYLRVFYLGDDEADYLRGQLDRLVFPVTVSRVEDRDGAA